MASPIVIFGRLAVIMGGSRKEICVNNSMSVRLCAVIMLIDRMKVQGWEKKRRTQQNRQH
jgi:hypothetical protein